MINSRKLSGFVWCVLAIVMVAAEARAQTTVKTEMVTKPVGSGAGLTCSFRVYLDPTVPAVSGQSIGVWYDGTRLAYTSAVDYTGQPAAGVLITLNPPTADATHAPDADTRLGLDLSTVDNINNPGNMMLITFTTTAAYVGPPSSLLIWIGDKPGGGGGYLDDGDFSPIPHNYNAHDPSAGDYSLPMMCPVTLSAMSVE